MGSRFRGKSFPAMPGTTCFHDLRALVDILEAGDVVLAEVAAGLHADQVEPGKCSNYYLTDERKIHVQS
jgi:hypothetical protein